MKYEARDLVKEYYEEIKNDYPELPGLTLDQVKDVCYAPFRFVAKIMARGYMQTIKFTYWGKFIVTKTKAERKLKWLTYGLAKGKITKEEHDHLQLHLIKHLHYLNEHDEEDDDHDGEGPGD